MSASREGRLLAWQWALYAEGHRDRRNLIVHALTVPLFQLGTLALLSAPFLGGVLAAAGLGAMVGAMALQGRTHRLEPVPPAGFKGPADVFARIFAEQWITFPRFVLSGAFARAWRGKGLGR
jgi:hypothetical protein